MALSARDLTKKRAQRVRTRLKKVSSGRPRLSVFRSSKNIYAQVIDDVAGVNLVAASSLEGDKKRGSDKDAVAAVCKLVAEHTNKKNNKNNNNKQNKNNKHNHIKALA